ncbi:MAG: hypothetical protein EON86_19645, partial [Brevundimonas sp.]
MSRLLPLAVALAMTVAPAALAQDHGRGHGPEKGAERGRGPDRPQARPERGPDRAEGRGNRAEAGPRQRPEVREPREMRQVREAVEQRRDDRRDDRRDREVRRDGPARLPVVLPGQDRVRDIVRFERPRDRVLLTGCPPGLARKGNGCLPPGQARRIEAERRARYDYVWDRMARDDYRYRYDDGYLYRVNNSGGLLGWLPVLGGALSTGSVWPTQYSYQPAPTYYTDYYRLPDRYDYRYADGVLYGVDRQDSGISQIAALLTGQQWTVGQAMPAGYDIYNVPYA